MTDPKQTLHNYLRSAREAVLWKVDGVSEYDVRRPLTLTGTNLLGLVKHLTNVEAWYFGKAFDRPFAEPLLWDDDERDPQADLWVRADEAAYSRVKKKSWFASSGPVLTPVPVHRSPPHVSAEIPKWRVVSGGKESPWAARHPVRSTVTLSVFAGSAGRSSAWSVSIPPSRA